MIQKVQLYKGGFPEPRSPTSLHGDKLHQVYQNSKRILQNFLNGYILPSPHYEEKLTETIETLTKCLRDPALPLLELQVNPLNK